MLSKTHHLRRSSPTRRSRAWTVGVLATAALMAMAIFASGALAAESPVGLGTADSFAVLAGSTVTNTGPSLITGNLGVSPGTAVTGFPPGLVLGATHQADAVAGQAQSDLTIAYNDAALRTSPAALVSPGDLGGLTLTPGLYNASSSIGLTGTLTLDAQGDPSAVFIFQVGTTLTTASASRVNLINGAQACNVFWQIGTSAVLGHVLRLRRQHPRPDVDHGHDRSDHRRPGAGAQRRPSRWTPTRSPPRTARAVAVAAVAVAPAAACTGVPAAVVTPPVGTPPIVTPPGATPPGSHASGQHAPGQHPSGQHPPGSTPPGSTPPGSTPPGTTPPGGTAVLTTVHAPTRPGAACVRGTFRVVIKGEIDPPCGLHDGHKDHCDHPQLAVQGGRPTDGWNAHRGGTRRVHGSHFRQDAARQDQNLRSGGAPRRGASASADSERIYGLRVHDARRRDAGSAPLRARAIPRLGQLDEVADHDCRLRAGGRCLRPDRASECGLAGRLRTRRSSPCRAPEAFASVPIHMTGLIAWVSATRPITGEQTVLPVLAQATDNHGRAWLRVRLPGRTLRCRRHLRDRAGSAPPTP